MKDFLLYFTFTVTTAFFFPAFTVIFAVPAFFAFTTPFAFTVATFLLLLVNFIFAEAVTAMKEKEETAK